MTLEFTYVGIEGKFDCGCSLNETEYQCAITPKSVKIQCRKCDRIIFYRRVNIE